jgi:Mn2+/Fe2+ NRAMP family transporter
MQITETLRKMGPGLLYAGAAIGVSHLVQSTRAGADFGFQLVAIILVANLLKYPFFEFAPRYTAATGNNLITGYSYVGKWAVWIYVLLTFSTMYVVQAGVTVVTAGLFGNIFGLNWDPFWISFLLLSLTAIMLVLGRYQLLDKLMKLIIVLLAVSTISAVVAAYIKQGMQVPEMPKIFDLSNPTHLAFLIAFFGWMPAPFDLSVWQSLWAEAKNEGLKSRVSLKDALLDFNIGYITTVVLATGFLSLGALLMYGGKEAFSDSSAGFAAQVIALFTGSIGLWAYPIIATAAFTTMFSTTLTCFDAYSRSMTPALKLALPQLKINSKKSERNWQWFWMLILFFGTLVILKFFGSSMKGMVDFATTMSFVLAPILALLNYLVLTHPHMPIEAQPKKAYRIFTLISWTMMTGFSIFYLIWRYLY